MKKRTLILFVAVVLMVGATAALLAHLRSNQKLGKPGVKTVPLVNSSNLEVVLPEIVGDFTSEKLEQQQIVIDTLPKDTSFGYRVYKAPDGFWSVANVVLMGSDRTSIHKPQICLVANGWRIEGEDSREEKIHIERPVPYDLPVMKLIASRTVTENGQRAIQKAVYVYWFVADNEYTAQHWQRMWWMARDLFSTGVLQRWAYVTYLSVCRPGQEDATFERMKPLIAASVPEFQLVPAPGQNVARADEHVSVGN